MGDEDIQTSSGGFSASLEEVNQGIEGFIRRKYNCKAAVRIYTMGSKKTGKTKFICNMTGNLEAFDPLRKFKRPAIHEDLTGHNKNLGRDRELFKKISDLCRRNDDMWATLASWKKQVEPTQAEGRIHACIYANKLFPFPYKLYSWLISVVISIMFAAQIVRSWSGTPIDWTAFGCTLSFLLLVAIVSGVFVIKRYPDNLSGNDAIHLIFHDIKGESYADDDERHKLFTDILSRADKERGTAASAFQMMVNPFVWTSDDSDLLDTLGREVRDLFHDAKNAQDIILLVQNHAHTWNLIKNSSKRHLSALSIINPSGRFAKVGSEYQFMDKIDRKDLIEQLDKVRSQSRNAYFVQYDAGAHRPPKDKPEHDTLKEFLSKPHDIEDKNGSISKTDKPLLSTLDGDAVTVTLEDLLNGEIFWYKLSSYIPKREMGKIIRFIGDAARLAMKFPAEDEKYTGTTRNQLNKPISMTGTKPPKETHAKPSAKHWGEGGDETDFGD